MGTPAGSPSIVEGSRCRRGGSFGSCHHLGACKHWRSLRWAMHAAGNRVLSIGSRSHAKCSVCVRRRQLEAESTGLPIAEPDRLVALAKCTTVRPHCPSVKSARSSRYAHIEISGNISSSREFVTVRQPSLSVNPDAPHVWEKIRLVTRHGEEVSLGQYRDGDKLSIRPSAMLSAQVKVRPRGMPIAETHKQHNR